MAPRRMETKPVILCVKTVLLLYCLVFWVSKYVPFTTFTLLKVALFTQIQPYADI